MLLSGWKISRESGKICRGVPGPPGRRQAIDLEIVALIPARGGSKGIPHKNIKPLAGKPLIAHTIEQARACPLISRVIVSTDDERIAAISRKFGAEVPFLRPKELAQDTTPILPVLQHAVSYIEKEEGKRIDAIVLLEPTSPLREVSDIEECLRKLLEEGADSVITICEAEHNPYFVMVKLKGDKLIPFVKNREVILGKTRRQDLPPVYRMNGGVFAVRRYVLMEKNALFTSNTKGVVVPQERSINIDHPVDFEIARWLMRQRQREKE